MQTIIYELGPQQRAEMLGDLVPLWRTSVEATHTFLTPDDIDRIEGYVPQAMRDVEHLVIAEDVDGTLHGFLGVDGETVEMLFLHPLSRGKGIGSQLLACALESYGATRLDVNEQNEQARCFYERKGFRTIGRSETDDMGDPFPILHMQLGKRRAEGEKEIC